MTSRSFRSMGTDVELLVDSDEADRALEAAEAEFHRLDASLSRFRAESELSRLNSAGSIAASPDLHRITGLALAARAQTEGRFDPTVHDAVVAAGYDRTFSEVAADGPAVRPARCRGGVEVMRDGTITLDRGVRLDFGGIGKGYAAERAAEILATAGNCLVNAGGDIAVRGGAWPIAVQTSDGTLTVELRAGGLATSGTDRRRWRRGGRVVHHLIDPATGSPATADVVRTTVVAGDAVAAEIWATAFFLAGTDAAQAEADARRLPTVLVSRKGRTVVAGGLR